jgi:hypothetical protein
VNRSEGSIARGERGVIAQEDGAPLQERRYRWAFKVKEALGWLRGRERRQGITAWYTMEGAVSQRGVIGVVQEKG